MCYDVSYLTKKADKYAKHYGKKSDWEIVQGKMPPMFHASGFAHPDLPVIFNDNVEKVQLCEWGLVPRWVKDPASAAKLANNTINARSEDMFEKPSFRQVAKTNHCLVIIDGFFEHYWKEGKSYPHFIKPENDEPLVLAGIYDEWNGKRTFSILTTKANKLLAAIHNNPKAHDGPRMPVILSPESAKDWLKPIATEDDLKKAQQLFLPLEDMGLTSYTVPKLRGKSYPGNKPEVIKKHRYQELESPSGTLNLFD